MLKKLDVEAGQKVTFDEVILVGGESTKVGAPIIAGATVEGTVEKHGKQKKVVTFKYKPKKSFTPQTRSPSTLHKKLLLTQSMHNSYEK